MLFLYIAIVLLVLALLTTAASTAAADAAPTRYPHLDPFLGLDLAVQTWRDFQRGELCEGLRRRHARYGATFAARTPAGAATVVYTTEPANIRAVTTRAFGAFGKAAWVAEAAKHVGSGVLTSEGDAWRRSRALLRPLFARAARAEPAARLEPHVRSLVAEMRRRGSAVFDFHELASVFTLDVVTEFLFGKSTDCLGNPEQADGRDGVDFLSLVKGFEGPSAAFMAVGPLAWLGLLRSYRRLIGLVAGMRAFFRKKLDGIITDSDVRGCAPRRLPEFLEVSPSIFRSMKDAGLSDDRIQGELQNIFFASYDTTSTFLANLMYVLVRHPDVQAKIRQEMAGLQGRPPTSKELAGMEYLRMVIMEALRLYSPVSSHSRTAKVDATLPTGGGLDGQSPFLVRAGATVVWSTYALNRDPQRYGDDWADFRPDRWAATWKRPKQDTPSTAAVGAATDVEGERDRLGGRGADAIEIAEGWRDFFMPFGSGPRTCLGQAMVQTEVAYVLVRLLQELPKLAVDAADVAVPFKEARAVSFYNEGGVHIRVN